jgi:catechol 2,3-dioxygenase-like lactoylglutathione lyase family enzyme
VPKSIFQASRVGYLTLTTPDLARQLAYYTEVIGLTVVAQTTSRAVLATNLGHEAVVLEHGDSNSCTGISLQVSPRTDLEEAAAAIREKRIACEFRSEVTPGVRRALSFEDPKGTRVDVFADYLYPPEDRSQSGIMPFKLGHIAFSVADVERVVDFYIQVLGFRVSDWRGDFFAFLRCGPDHHSINFVRGEQNALHHIAFELRDWAEIQRACDFLAKRDIHLVLGPIRHIIGHNIATYHKNPDDILIELFTELDQMKDEELGYFDPRPWHQDRPQRPKVWGPDTLTNYWGPGRLTPKP